MLQGDKKGFSIPAAELSIHLPAWEYHIHTLFSDGVATIRECAKRAHDKGLSRIVFTEHTEPWKTKMSGWFTEYVSDVRETAQHYSGVMEIYLGVEAAATDFDKGLELTEEMGQEADYILGAAHRYPGLDGQRVRNLPSNECMRLEFATLMALANNPKIDAIAHIGGTCSQYGCEFPDELAEEVVRTACRNGIAIELNSRYHKPLSNLYDICVRENALITIGSDAHTPDDIGNSYSMLYKIIGKTQHV